MELGSRRIVHFNVSESPGLAWVKQQIREISPYGEGPRFLIHDNDGIFGQFADRKKQQAGECGDFCEIVARIIVFVCR